MPQTKELPASTLKYFLVMVMDDPLLGGSGNELVFALYMDERRPRVGVPSPVGSSDAHAEGWITTALSKKSPSRYLRIVLYPLDLMVLIAVCHLSGGAIACSDAWNNSWRLAGL
jgi:hypothetical protein